MNIEKENTLNDLNNIFSQFIDYLRDDIKNFNLDHFKSDETMLIIVDMVNGFVREGALASPFVDAISGEIANLAKKCDEIKIPIIAYADTHNQNCREFNSFPAHCISGTHESELIDELKNIKNIIRVEKNSTNSFLAKNPLKIIESGEEKVKNILVTGCVTDICVRDFCKTMNKYLDQMNINANIYLVENLIETYEIEGVHNRQVEHLLALYDMKNSGINIIRIN